MNKHRSANYGNSTGLEIRSRDKISNGLCQSAFTGKKKQLTFGLMTNSPITVNNLANPTGVQTTKDKQSN